MRRVFSLFVKEMQSYFNAPIAYIVISFSLSFTSLWFFYIRHFAAMNTASMRTYFEVMPALFIIILPALTMRSWAEEKKAGTDELLITLPFSETELVLGKFFAAFTILILFIFLSIILPFTIDRLGRFETGQIISEYVGIILLGGVGISIGLFLSSICRNQISAFILSVAVLLVLTLSDQLAVLANVPDWLSAFSRYLSLSYHFDSFRKGVLDSRDLSYFIILSVLFLYLNTRTLILRKWR